MAFFGKAGSIFQRTLSNHISQGISFSKPSIFQAIRCMSSSKLFIGGLSWSTDDSSLREAFNKYGEIADVRVIKDRDSGRSRGFGFVTYSSVEEASAAIQALDQQELHGRRIRVDYANDRTRGYGGYGGSNYGGYNNNNDGTYGYGDGSSNFNSGVNNSYGSASGGYDGGNSSYGGDHTDNEAAADQSGSLEGGSYR